MISQGKKLAYIINGRLPTEKAYGYQIVQMCLAFSRQGVQVEIIAPTRKNQIKADLFSFYKISPVFKVRYIKSIDFISGWRWLGRLRGYLQKLFFLLSLFKLDLDKQKTIIFTRHTEVAWLFHKRGFKVVYECHDWFGRSQAISLFLLQGVDLIVATNEYIRSKFLENGFAASKVVSLPHGVDHYTFDVDIQDKEQALAKLKVNDSVRLKLPSKKILFYSGSFTTMGHDKGLIDTFDALRFLDKEIVLVAVGGSQEEIDYYKQVAKQVGVEDRVFLFGRVTQSDLALWQKIGDIMLAPFPRRAHFEYFMTPLKIFEYLLSRRPILSSNLPSLQLWLDEDVCFFYQAGDSQDLAMKVKEIFANYKQALQKADRAYQLSKDFSWDKRAGKILNLINSI